MIIPIFSRAMITEHQHHTHYLQLMQIVGVIFLVLNDNWQDEKVRQSSVCSPCSGNSAAGKFSPRWSAATEGSNYAKLTAEALRREIDSGGTPLRNFLTWGTYRGLSGFGVFPATKVYAAAFRLPCDTKQTESITFRSKYQFRRESVITGSPAPAQL